MVLISVLSVLIYIAPCIVHSITYTRSCNMNSVPSRTKSILHFNTLACISKCIGVADEYDKLNCTFNPSDGSIEAKLCPKCPKVFDEGSREMLRAKSTYYTFPPVIKSICGKKIALGLGAEDEFVLFFGGAMVSTKELKSWDPVNAEEIRCVVEKGLSDKQKQSQMVWTPGYRPACRKKDFTYCGTKRKPFFSDMLPWAPKDINDTAISLENKDVCVMINFSYDSATKNVTKLVFKEADCSKVRGTCLSESIK